MEDKYIIKDGTLYHAGVKGMSWGKHLPGTDWWKEKATSAVNSIKNTVSNSTAVRSYNNYMNKNTFRSQPNVYYIDKQTGKSKPGGIVARPSRSKGIMETAKNMARAGIASAKVSAKNLGKNISNRASYTAYKAKKGTSKLWNETKGYASEKIANLKKAANTAYLNNRKQVLDFFIAGNNSKSGTISGNTYLDNFVNTQLEQASKAYTNAITNGGAGNLINSFIQTAQYRVSKGINNYLKSIGMDDNVQNFIDKFRNRSNTNSVSVSNIKKTNSGYNRAESNSPKINKSNIKIGHITDGEKKRNKTRPSY